MDFYKFPSKVCFGVVLCKSCIVASCMFEAGRRTRRLSVFAVAPDVAGSYKMC